MHRKKIAIAGAGIAGLSAAARLAALGHEVHLFDKNAVPGGKLGLLETDGYSFDTGPSLFTQPYLLESLFQDCGKRLSDYFQYISLDVSTHYFWQDGTFLKAHKNHDTLAGAIENAMHVDPTPTLRHLEDCRRAYEAIGTIFLDEPIHKLKTWMSPRILRALKALKLPWLTQTMHDYHQRVLNHPHLVQLFDRFATYNGSDAYRAPAMLCMIAHLELNEGAGYPTGGMISIPRALHQLCKDLGVQVHLQTDVQQILHERTYAHGLVVNGARFDADVVIAAGDVHHVYTHLLRDCKRAAFLERDERSDSAFVFYWGIGHSFPQLHLHNIFFATQNDRTQNVYVNITSKMEEGIHAPMGKENWFTMIVVPPAGNDVSQEAVAEQTLRAHALGQVSRMLGQDVAPLIELERTLSPTRIQQQTYAYRGALYGTASNKTMAAFHRHPNRHARIQNLFFAGGTVHPGGGIPLCLRSGRIVSDMVSGRIR